MMNIAGPASDNPSPLFSQDQSAQIFYSVFMPFLFYSTSNINTDTSLNPNFSGFLTEPRPQIEQASSWRNEHDQLLLRLAIQYKQDWKKIAKRFLAIMKIEVNSNYLRIRYKEIKVKTSKDGKRYKYEDDLKILAGVLYHGNTWNLIASYIPQRNGISIRNRYYSAIHNTDYYKELMKDLEGKDLKHILVGCAKSEKIEE